MTYRTTRRLCGLVFLLFLISLPFRLAWRGVQQEGRNRALNTAIRAKQWPEALALLQKGASPNAREAPEDTHPLWQHMLDGLRGRRSPAKPGKPALLLALETMDTENYSDENIAVARALVGAGAEVNVRGNVGYTPLICAALHPNVSLFRDLVQKGANVNARNGQGQTALICVAQFNTPDALACLRILLQRGADVNAKDSDGENALSMAIFPIFTRVIQFQSREDRENRYRMVEALLNQGADVNAEVPWPCTPLIVVAQSQLNEFARLLLAHGAKVDMKDNAGYTALWYAHHDRNQELVQMLKEAGAKE